MILYGYFQVALSLLAILLSSIFLLGLAAFLNTTLRKPILLRRKFNAKGINGPAYRFFFGNAREILKMKAEASAKPMSSLSHNIFPRLQPHLPAWTDKYGKSFVFWMGPEPMLLISEPELVRVVLNETGKDYQKMEVKGYMLKLFGDGLATSRGEKWAKMKKLANHAFQGDSLKNMIPSMIASTEMMLERWNDHLGEEVEVFKEFTFLTAEVISRTAFGSSYLKGKLVFSKLHKLLELAAKNIFKITIPGLRLLYSKVYKLKDEIKAEQLEQVIRDSIIEMIRKREEMVVIHGGEEEEDSYGSDFLGLLLKAHHEADESKKITVDDVVDECKTFYLAGQESCNILLSWVMLLLSINTDWQEEARKEVDAVFGLETPNPDGISKLKIVGMIVSETLRLYPPAFDMIRKVEKEVQLGKYTVPANTHINISILSFQHDPEVWGEDVHLFNPGRFAEGVAKATGNHPTAFFPYGMGSRLCTGFNFAAVETKIVLSMILQRYSFTLSPAYVHSLWLTPIRVQSQMRAQGIKGPSYRFFHGNTKEIAFMRIQAAKLPMELSHHVLPRLQPHIYTWTKLYGNNFLQWYGSRAQLVVTEPELIKEVLNCRDGAFEKIGFQDFIRDLLGDGLVLSRGDKWSKMRKLATHAFHGESLKVMVPAMISSVEMMLERWEKNNPDGGKTEIDAFEEFRILTSEIISRTAFGSSYLEGEKVFGLLMKMVSIISRNHYKVRIPGLHFPCRSLFRTGDEHESAVIQQEIKSIIINMVSKRKEENSTSSATDFLGMLLKAYTDPDRSNSITLDDLVDECKTFYVAGHETTTSSLTWTVLLLALHSEWQDKAREQVVKLFGKDTTPTPDGISRLSILTMIINESLRLYPPVFHVSRRVERDVRLGGKLMLSKGTEVYIPNLAVHHDTGTWGEDAQLFKPERFAEGVVAKGSSGTFLPFGMGARNCVGMNFAITEEKIALSMILQRYRFRLSDKYVHSPAQVLTSCPKHGLQIVLEKL
ncbi:Cytochrome P450 CYP749A22 [Linum perenne]